MGTETSFNLPNLGNVGGFVGEQAGAIRGMNVPQIGGIEQQAGNVGGVAGQLQGGFGLPSQLTQGAHGTLGSMIQTGSPVDVAPLTEAAQSEAGRTFQDLMGQTNEQFGALNLGSSSARQGQLGRQAAGLSQAVGETGLRAGVGAQEAARGRQLQGIGQFGNLQGQAIGALGSAGGLFGTAGGLMGQAGGLNLAQQTGQTTAGQNLISSQMPTFNQSAMAPPPAPPPPPASTMGTWGIGQYADGGRVDLGDFMSEMLFGRQFDRPAPVPQQIIQIPQQQYRPQSFEPPRSPGRPVEQFTGFGAGNFDAQANAQRAADAFQFADALVKSSPGSISTGVGVADLAQLINAIGIPAAQQGLMQSGQILGGLGQQSQSAQASVLGDLIRSQGLTQSQGQGILSPSASGFQRGGVIQGPSQPPDQVPVLAQGGEGFIPLGLMDRLEKSKSSDPLVKELKALMFSSPSKAKAKKKGCGGAIKKEKGGVIPKMQAGGIPTQQGNQTIQDILNAIQAGIPVPGFTGGDNLTVTDPQQGANVLSGGTVSELGLPPAEQSPDEILAQQMEDAQRRSSLLQSALTLDPAANREKLVPMLQQSQQEIQQLAQMQDALQLRRVQEQQNVIAGQQAATDQANVVGLNEFRRLQGQAMQPQEVDPQAALNAQRQTVVEKHFGRTNELSGNPVDPQIAVAGAIAEFKALRDHEYADYLQQTFIGAEQGVPGQDITIPKNPTELNQFITEQGFKGQLPPEVLDMARQVVATLEKAGISKDEIKRKWPVVFGAAFFVE